MRRAVGRARGGLFAALFVSAVMVLALIMLVMVMPGVVASRWLTRVHVPNASIRTVRATTGPVGHRIVRQMAQRRGRRVEGQQPPADQIANNARHFHQLKAAVRLLSLIASRKGCQAVGSLGSG